MKIHLWPERGGFTCENCTPTLDREGIRQVFPSTGEVLILFLSNLGRSMKDFPQISEASLQYMDPISARTFLEYLLHSLQFHLPGCDFSKFKTTGLVESLRGVSLK
jgi:hypothetical protein